jgi:hypothetical protein
MNIPNLTRVRDHIASLKPEQFNMDRWNYNEATGRPASLIHDCGSCGCIGGWTEALFPDEEADVTLGLDNYGNDLFYPKANINYRSITIPQAVAVLDHLIKTGEVKWN